MADLNGTNFIIRAKRGVVADLNTTEHKSISYLGELAYTTDTNELYIFDGTEYVLALDLSGLVPYTGATNDLDLGVYNLRQTSGADFTLIQNDGSALTLFGLNTSDVNTIAFGSQISNLKVTFDLSDIATTSKSFKFPNQSGTFALTTDIPAALTQPQVMARISIGF
jgi:hypothetical protein